MLALAAFVAVAGRRIARTAGPEEAPDEEQAAGPGRAVQDFYRHLNDGNYPQAQAMYDSEALDTIGDPDVMGEGGFEAWALAETHNGTVRRVDIVSADELPNAATVRYKVFFEDGSAADKQVTLVSKTASGGWDW